MNRYHHGCAIVHSKGHVYGRVENYYAPVYQSQLKLILEDVRLLPGTNCAVSDLLDKDRPFFFIESWFCDGKPCLIWEYLGCYLPRFEGKTVDFDNPDTLIPELELHYSHSHMLDLEKIDASSKVLLATGICDQHFLKMFNDAFAQLRGAH